jgi:chromosome segregation ATPase
MTRTPAAQPPAIVAENMFLSPRVVDAGTFEELAGALRTLVTKASDQSATLGSAVTRTEVVVKQLGQVGPAVESKLTAAAAATKALSSRQAELEALLSRAERRAEQAERAATDLETRVARSLDERAAVAEARLASLLSEGLGRIEAAAARASTIVGDAVAASEHAIDAARSRLEAAIEDWRSRLDPLHERAELHAASIEARLTRAETRIAPFLGAGVKSLSVLCAKAAAMLGREPGTTAPSAEGSLTDLVQRAERAREAVDFAVGQLGAVREQAERARTLLGQEIVSSAETVETFAARQDAIRQAMESTMSACERARQELEAHANLHLSVIERAAAAARDAAPPAVPAPLTREPRRRTDPKRAAATSRDKPKPP